MSGYGSRREGTTDYKRYTEDFSEGQVLYTQVLGTPLEPAARAAYPNRFAFYDRVVARERASFDSALTTSADAHRQQVAGL